MSRSRKKISVPSCNAGSMRAFKQQVNRGVRRVAKQAINHCVDYDELIIPVQDDILDLYSSPKDAIFVQWTPFHYWSDWRQEWSPGVEQFEKYKRK